MRGHIGSGARICSPLGVWPKDDSAPPEKSIVIRGGGPL